VVSICRFVQSFPGYPVHYYQTRMGQPKIFAVEGALIICPKIYRVALALSANFPSQKGVQ